MPNLVYDITTVLGQTRFQAADTDITLAQDGVTLVDNSIFSDAEIAYALGLNAQDPILSAAMLLQALATDKARVAIISSRGSGNTDVSKLSDTYAARAAELRRMANIEGAIAPPDPVFTPDYEWAGGCPGSMRVW